jgi:hypothetical protein
LGIGQEDGGWRIGLECGQEALPNRIRGQQKREPLNVWRGLSHSGARHRKEGAVI